MNKIHLAIFGVGVILGAGILYLTVVPPPLLLPRPESQIATDDFETYYCPGPCQPTPLPTPPPAWLTDPTTPLSLPLTLNCGTGAWMSPWTGGEIAILGSVGGHNLGRVNKNLAKNEAIRSFTNPKATKELFVSFDLIVRSEEPDMRSHYAYAALTYGVNNHVLSVGKESGSNEIKLGQLDMLVSSGISIENNKTYRIVAGYDRDQEVLFVWVNPNAQDYYSTASGGGSMDAVVTKVGDPGDASTVRLYTSHYGYYFDNIVVANAPDAEGIGLKRRLYGYHAP